MDAVCITDSYSNRCKYIGSAKALQQKFCTATLQETNTDCVGKVMIQATYIYYNRLRGTVNSLLEPHNYVASTLPLCIC